jgi:5'-3' exonuclease
VSKTLLVDGDNLFKIGFHGAKDLFNDGSHVGGVYHFINTLRRFLEEYNLDKVVVFWDGESNSSARKLIYPQYKANRRFSMDESKYESYLEKRIELNNILKRYLLDRLK